MSGYWAIEIRPSSSMFDGSSCMSRSSGIEGLRSLRRHTCPAACGVARMLRGGVADKGSTSVSAVGLLPEALPESAARRRWPGAWSGVAGLRRVGKAAPVGGRGPDELSGFVHEPLPALRVRRVQVDQGLLDVLRAQGRDIE